MSEPFAWREGVIYAWTGSATASAAVAYARDARVSLTRGYRNQSTLNGTYHDTYTGQRADASFGGLFAPDHTTLYEMFNATGVLVHLHFKHAHSLGSAGVFLYSGKIDAINIQGSDPNPMNRGFTYHANSWSAY